MKPSRAFLLFAGRYGKETSGVTGGLSEIMGAAAKVGVGLDSDDEYDAEIIDAINKCSWRTDSMGYDSIVY